MDVSQMVDLLTSIELDPRRQNPQRRLNTSKADEV